MASLFMHRLVAGLMIFSLVGPAMADGVSYLSANLLTGVQEGIGRIRKPITTFSQKPIRPPLPMPSRFENKPRGMWTPEALEALDQMMLNRAIESQDFHAMVTAYTMVLNNSSGGHNEGGPGQGEEPGNPGGSGYMVGSQGLQGISNTATGNLLTKVNIVSWEGRGETGVDLTLFHNSFDDTDSPLGFGWSHSYDMRLDFVPSSGLGSVDTTFIEMPDGTKAPYTWDSISNSYVRPSGFFYNLQKTSSSPNTWVLTSQSGHKYTLRSNGNVNVGHLVQIEDRQGNKVTVNRDSLNRVTTVYADDNANKRRQLEFIYAGSQPLDDLTTVRVTETSTGVFEQLDLAQDAAGDLFTLAYGNSTAHLYREMAYDASHNIISESDAEGVLFMWDYDTGTEHNIMIRSGIESYETNYLYTGSGANRSVKIRPPGVSTASPDFIEHTYIDHRITQSRDQAGFFTTMTYQTGGDKNLATVTTQHTPTTTRVTSYTWNAFGRPLTITDGEGFTTTYAWNADHQLELITPPSGSDAPRTDLVYNANKQLEFVREEHGPAGAPTAVRTVQTNTYTTWGDLLTTKDALNRTATLEYDANGWGTVVKITDPAGVETSMTPAPFTGPTEVKKNNVTRATVQYDPLGRPIQINRTGDISLMDFDSKGKITWLKDPKNGITTWEYRPDGLLSKKVNPRGDIEEYFYDLQGRLTSIKNGRGITRTYETSPRGEITKMTMPQNGNTPALATQNLIETWTYTPNGEVSRFQSPMRDIYYEYDRRGLMTKVDYPDPNVDTTFTYDQLGRRTSMVDSTGTTSWDFDAWGDLIEMVSPQGTVRYEFNTAREMTRLINVQTGGNLVTEYVRNTAGQVEEIKSAYNEVTTLWYDTFGRLEQKDLPHGLSEFIGYDSQDRLSSIEIRNAATNAVVSSQSYAYDAASNVATHIQDNVRTDYTYDANHQLLSETKRNGVLTTSPITYTGVYTYDANGNRLSRTVNGVQEVYTVDQGDKLLSIAVGGSNVRTFGYDNDGRTTNDSRLISGSWQNRVYTYDIESRITNIDLPGTTADPSYTYNGLDTRIGQVISGNTTSWKRSGAYVTDSVLNEGSVAFTPGVSSRSGSTSTFTHAGLKNTDRQSTTTALSATRQYDAFGNLVSSTGTWNTRFGYAGNFGYQGDDNTGLKLLGHRYYDSSTGRFLTRDPIKDGRNWYSYGGGESNPLDEVDPEGLKGHHIVPRQIWGGKDTKGTFSKEVEQVFDSATTGTIPGGHNFGDGHGEYNTEVNKLLDRFLKQRGKTRGTMTAADAIEFVNTVLKSGIPAIKNFLDRIYNRIGKGRPTAWRPPTPRVQPRPSPSAGGSPPPRPRGIPRPRGGGIVGVAITVLEFIFGGGGE